MSKIAERIAETIRQIEEERGAIDPDRMELPEEWKPRKLTVRLGPISYGQLLLVAKSIEESKTGTLEDLAAAALEEAILGLGYGSTQIALPDVLKALEAEREGAVD